MTEFDLDAYRLTPERLTKLQKLQLSQTKKRLHRASPRPLCSCPMSGRWRRPGGSGTRPLAVLVELAYQAFKTHQNVVPLANARLQSVGVGPDAKVRALRHLEADGLVSVDWRGGRKTPHVTLLWIT